MSRIDELHQKLRELGVRVLEPDFGYDLSEPLSRTEVRDVAEAILTGDAGTFRVIPTLDEHAAAELLANAGNLHADEDVDTIADLLEVAEQFFFLPPPGYTGDTHRALLVEYDKWYCQNCDYQEQEAEFLPSDGNPAPHICPKCGSTECFVAK